MKRVEIGLCWGTVYKAGLADMIELTARHGFPTLSVHPYLYTESLDAGVDGVQLRQRIRDSGISITVIDCIIAGLPGVPSGPIPFFDRTLPRADEALCFQIAEELEAPIVNVIHYGAAPTPRAVLVDAIAGICRRAAPRGLQIVLEYSPGTGIPDLAEGHAMARDTGEANCALLLDTWNMARTGERAADIAALAPNAIGAVQLSDRKKKPPGTTYVPISGRLLPGEGEMPLHDIIAAALANSPGIPVEIEVFSEELASMPVDDAAARTAAAVNSWQASRADD